jgi:hypothetical protein
VPPAAARSAPLLFGRPLPAPSWGAALAAASIGFGLLVGIAIGPGANGVGFASGFPSLIRIPGLGVDGDTSAGGDAGGPLADSGAPALGSPVGNASSPPPPAAPAPATAPAPLPAAPPTARAAPPSSKPPPDNSQPPPDQTTPPPDDSLALSGTVVHLNPGAGSYVIAASDAQLSAVHARDLPQPGTDVEVKVRELADGTYAESGDRSRQGRSSDAKVSGIVTFRDPVARTYTISRRGLSLLVHMPPAPTEAPGSPPPPEPPALGEVATVTATIERLPAPTDASAEPDPSGADANPLDPAPLLPQPEGQPPPAQPAGCAETGPRGFSPQVLLTQTKLQTEGDPLGYSDFEGIVQTTCSGPRRLVLSADDLREGEADIVFSVPREIDLSAIEPGQTLDVSAVFGPDVQGFELSGLSSEEGTKGADDASLAQGDQSS